MTPGKKIAKYTCRPCGDQADPVANETIVLAQLGDSLAEAFNAARKLLGQGQHVRIIGPGVTLRRVWPEWALKSSRLTLTEWGAFTPVSLADATREIEGDLRAWIDDIFGGDFAGKPPDKVFFSAACQRFFQPVLLAYPIARGIADAFPGATVHCVRPDAVTGRLVRQLMHPRHAAVAEGAIGRLSWRTRMLVMGTAALAFAASRATRDYVNGAPTLKEIRRHRSVANVPHPSTWVAVLPDWYRMNHHLIDAFALPATEQGIPLGILFTVSLAPFERDEAHMRQHHQSSLWPGLGKLRSRLGSCVVEQAVAPERPIDFVRSLAIGVARGARVVRRLSSLPEIRLQSMSYAPRFNDILPWATMDVVRATLSDEAAADLLRGRSMRETTVIATGANCVVWTPVDLALQAAGATTVDHPHGAGSDVLTGMCVTNSTTHLFWTIPDANSAADANIRSLVTGMPLRFQIAPRTRRARRILLTTGYVHRDAETVFGFRGGASRFPHRIFQPEMLEIVRLLRERGHSSLEFRWRPHPSDIRSELQDDIDQLEGVEISIGRSLEDDVAWADLMISCNSTVIIEALYGGIPIFVQVLPESDGLPSTSYLSSERVFFHAADGARAISDWLHRYGECPDQGLEPEQAARRGLFGASGKPVPMMDYFAGDPGRPTVVESIAEPTVQGA